MKPLLTDIVITGSPRRPKSCRAAFQRCSAEGSPKTPFSPLEEQRTRGYTDERQLCRSPWDGPHGLFSLIASHGTRRPGHWSVDGEAYFRYRRGGQLAGEGVDQRVDRPLVGAARPPRAAPEI